MKQVRILVAAILCIVIVAAMLAGCGTANSNQTTGAASQTGQSTQAPATTESKEPVVLKLLGITWRDYAMDAPGNQRVHDLIKQKYNIDIHGKILMKPDDWVQAINLAIASGEHYDMMQIENNNLLLKQLIDQDYLLPLDDLLQNYGKDILANADPQTWNLLKKNGKIYSLTNEIDANTTTMIIRKDLLDKYGLSMPTTISEFSDAVAQIKAKEKGMEGFVMYDPLAGLENPFLGSYIETGRNNYLDPADNKIKPWYIHPNYKKFLAGMQGLYKKGVVAKDFMTMKYEQADLLINSGKAIAYCISGANYVNFAIDALKKVVPTAEIVPLAPLKGDIEGSYTKNTSAGDFCVITKSCTNPEKAMEYANIVSGTLDGYMLAAYGEDEKDVKVVTSGTDGIELDPTYKNLVEADKYWSIFRFGMYNKIKHKVTFTGVRKWLDTVDSYKLCQGPDWGVPYDEAAYKDKDKIPDMLDYYHQEMFKTIMGQSSPDNWDNVVKDWLNKGGQSYIDDTTAQFNAGGSK